MKTIKRSSIALSIFVSLMLISGISIYPVSAQSRRNEPSARPLVQYSSEELELTRSRLTELLNTVQEFSSVLIPGDTQSAEVLEKARLQLAKFTASELSTMRSAMDSSTMSVDLAAAESTLNNFKAAMELTAKSSALRGKGPLGQLSPLPGIEPADAVCQALIGSGHASLAVVAAADAVFLAAKLIDIAANRACNQVVVAGVIILGEGAVGGGNTSAACIVSDGILFAAEKVREKISSCDDDFTKRSVDAAVARLATVHTDLESSVANDDSNKNTIIANDNSNKTSIVANDNANLLTIQNSISVGTTTVTTAVGDGTTTILNNANANRILIVNNDNANKNTIIADALANKEELKNIHLRTQIEADLSSTDGSTFVALFMTPSTVCNSVLNDKGTAQAGQQCGYLDLVRAIVAQTIVNIGGANPAQANAFLSKGDLFKNNGDFRQAYQNYRLAYRSAAK